MRSHLATLVDDFRKHGNATAIVTYRGNRRVASSYGDLAALVDRFSAELRRREIPSGERVVLWGLNSVEWVGAFFGCVLRGVIAVPLDAAGSAEFARRVIAETKPRLVVGDALLLAQLDSATARLAFGFSAADPVYFGNDGGAQGDRAHASQCGGERGSD
jgi:long-chain acyl-CoA synthetase